MSSNKTLQFYKNNNKQLARQYDSVSFESVHKDWFEYLPEKGELVLDVGAGSGRDAIWLDSQSYKVVAVEPVAEFYNQFKINYQDNGIEWLFDSLPELYTLEKYHNKISLILLSAVWMHLTLQERVASFNTFSKLNKQHGLLVISLRHGKSPDERLMYPVSIAEIESLANNNGYQIRTIKQSGDQLSRADVFWETIVLKKNIS